MNSFAEIKTKAAQTAKMASVEHSIPVPLEMIAASLGFQSLNFNGPDNLAGAIEYTSKRIFVNSNDPPTRQRFTLAHEIGHAVLHKNEDLIDYRKNLEGHVSERKEIEANFFAANLLMPEEKFREAWITRNGAFKRLAALFGVSTQAAQVRANSLGLA